MCMGKTPQPVGPDESAGWEDVYGFFLEDLPGIKQRVAAYFAALPVPVQGTGTADAADAKPCVRCIEFEQHAGEMVFVPSMWHHAVLNLTDTVAVTQNYCSRVNLRRCYSMMQDRALARRWAEKLRTSEKPGTSLEAASLSLENLSLESTAK